jgi:hypothetical protein
LTQRQAAVIKQIDWGGRETLKEKLKPYLQTGEWNE